jgi:hypothetical protein
VPRHYLETLSGPADRFVPTGSGRLELAELIASPANPLTARVMVNRIWQHVFGTGLVRTPDDFGHVGEQPSHPELLDYLAADFIADGWSVKRLIRKLVLTRAFRLANRPPASAKQTDPENRLLHHYSARRMEAEAIRDSMLAASGRLDRTLFGPSVHPYREGSRPERRLFPGPLDGNGRRSVYIKQNLMEGPHFLEDFNFPGGKVAQGRRERTSVPAQALALLNDPFVLQQAAIWAIRLVARPEESAGDRIDRMFLVALGRSPAAIEKRDFLDSLVHFAALRGVPERDVLTNKTVWADVAHTLFNLPEFITIP